MTGLQTAVPIHGEPLPRCHLAIVEPDKLGRYLLDPTHGRGGDKALVFRSALGLGPEHAEVFRDALLEGVRTWPVVKVELGFHDGTWKCTVDMEVDGPNGRRALVRTGWETWLPPRPPKLLSAKIKGRSWEPDG